MKRRRFWLVPVAVVAVLGCQSGPIRDFFAAPPVRTSYRTPAVRIAEAEALAAQATGHDTPEQQAMVQQLAQQIQAEPDPLVRRAIADAAGRFGTPLAKRLLLAGLGDADPLVREQCCRSLGGWKEAEVVAALQGVLADDANLDARLEATRTLGQIGTPEAVRALTAALEDRNPALQYVGVQASRQAIGRDLGNDVATYLAVARGETPPTAPEQPSVASRLRRWSPF